MAEPFHLARAMPARQDLFRNRCGIARIRGSGQDKIDCPTLFSQEPTRVYEFLNALVPEHARGEQHAQRRAFGAICFGREKSRAVDAGTGNEANPFARRQSAPQEEIHVIRILQHQPRLFPAHCQPHQPAHEGTQKPRPEGIADEEISHARNRIDACGASELSGESAINNAFDCEGMHDIWPLTAQQPIEPQKQANFPDRIKAAALHGRRDPAQAEGQEFFAVRSRRRDKQNLVSLRAQGER